MARPKNDKAKVAPEDAKVQPRTLLPKPTMWSKVEDGVFLTTDPSIVDALFVHGIKSTCRKGTEIVYAYPASETVAIQAFLKHN